MKKNINWRTGYLFFGFMVLLFAPIEIYMSAIEDVFFSVYDFAGYLLAFFIVFVFIWLVYEFIFSDKLKKTGTISEILIMCLGIAFYVQGNFIKVNYGELNGKAINWDEFRSEGVISVGIFVVAIIIAILTSVLVVKKKAYKTADKIMHGLAICLILLMLYTLTVVCITNDGFQKKDGYVSISEGRWDYSKDENYIILLLDNYDSRMLDDLLESEYKTEIEEDMEDFVYYYDMKGFYEYTLLALPQILTGRRYLNDVNYKDYLEESFEASPFLNELKKEDYRLKMHTTIDLPQKSMVGDVENWKYMNVGVDSHRRLLGYIYKLTGFRYLPQPLKKYCWFYTDDMNSMKEVTYAGNDKSISFEEGYYEWGNKYFHDNMSLLNTSLNGKVFHLTHLKGCHTIRNLDKDFNMVEDRDISNIETAYMNMELIDEYLDKLKELGIYDDSVIIIMADHGEIDYGTVPTEQCPLFMVKGRNEKHQFEISDKPVSYDDLQTCFINLMSGISADDSWGEIDENRVRYCYSSDYSYPKKTGHARAITEYAVKGGAKDGQNIEYTGNTYR